MTSWKCLRVNIMAEFDIMVLGKGLMKVHLPLAITVISEKLFSALNGSVVEGKALARGQSYTGNVLGCAAAKASTRKNAEEVTA